MKKNFYIITAAALSLVACSRNQEIDVPDSNLSLFARTESPAETKTVVESGVHVYWEPGDEIAVFTGEQSAKFTTDITAASGTATFKGTFGDATWPEDLDLWAVYPFSEDAIFDGETITTTLPSEQVAREGSFGKDMNLAIAHSSGTTLQFYNVGGGLRFSVTEEGIKKVMFEGLSGEIISGKVKIGMDENGKPVVQEVTGGSQFITLLPPTGKETFEPGAWYYIVAIPGSLEGGYKMRFYKDEDYARKVSEKKVEIKRSVFGNIEKADEGVEYEETTTHFPETDEEWEKSISSTNMIVKEWDKMVAKTISLESSSSVDPTSLASQITSIEGVSDVDIKGSTIVITQSDGIILNLLLDAYNWKNYMVDEEDTPSYSPRSILSASKQFRTSKITTPPTGGSVLVLSPAAFDSPILPEKLSEYEDIFKDIGFQNVNIDPVASIGMFYGKKLAEYDVVIFSTHGGIGTFNTVDGKGITSTIICSGTPYDESNKEVYMKRNPALAVVPKNFGQQIKQAINENVTNIGEVESITYLCMTPYFLDELDENAFNNCWIHFESCHTADYDSNGQRPMMQAFVDKGVSLVTGFYDSVSWPAVMYPMTYQLIKDMSLGLSFDDAYNRRNAVFRDCCDGYVIGDPFFLVNPYPTNLHNSEIRDCRTTLIWDQAKTRGDYQFKVHLKWPNSNSYTTYNATTSKEYTTDLLQPGEYSWYVEANLYYDGKVIETFISDTKSFTIKEDPIIPYSESVDLGLPSGTKWARFNVGASSPEEYGDHFAWGETEPKELYTWENYKWCKGTQNSLIKYCYDSEYGYNGFTDNLKTLLPEDDAASVNWKGYWRMPTSAESWELGGNTTISLGEYNGVKVFELKSKINGNVIYFPIAGYRDYEEYQYTGILDGGEYRGFYWCSDVDFNRTYDGYNYCLSNDEYYGFREGCSFGLYTWAHRNRGYTIRPVYK